MERLQLEGKLEKLTRFIEYFCTLLFVVMTTITFFQVVGRYLFGKSFFWAEELSRFTMIWIVFLGASVAVSQKAHTRIDFFINLLPPGIRRLIGIFDTVACMTFMLVVSYYSIGIVKISMRNLSTGLRVPLGFIYIALPVAGVLMTLYFLLQIYHLIIDKKQEEVEQNG